MKEQALVKTVKEQLFPVLLLLMFLSGITLLTVSGYFVWSGRAEGNLLLTKQGQASLFTQLQESNLKGTIISDTEIKEGTDILGPVGQERVVQVSWEADLNDSEQAVQEALREIEVPPLTCFPDSDSELRCQVNFSSVRIDFSQKGVQTIGTIIFPTNR